MNTTLLSPKEKLIQILHDRSNSIASCVIREALQHSDVLTFFETLAEYGCCSGVVSFLSKYADTHTFFDLYENEIQTLKEAYEKKSGTPLIITDDIKTQLAWFAFEEVAAKLYSEITNSF